MYTHLDVSNHDSNMPRRGTGIRSLVIAVYMYVTIRDVMNMCVYIYIDTSGGSVFFFFSRNTLRGFVTKLMSY